MKNKKTYLWQGKDENGNIIKGERISHSAIAVKAYLRTQQIIPTKMRKKPKSFFAKDKTTSKDITLFTRQLATLLAAGVPLVPAFEVIAKGQRNINLQQLINTLKDDIEEGCTLKEALQKHPCYFNELYCNLIGAGEQSGALDDIIERLATHKEKTESIKGKLKKVLFYPVAVVTVAFLVTVALLIFVVPQFETLFEGFGAKLPYPTHCVILLSDAVQNYWWLMLVALIGLTSIFVILKRRSINFSHRLERLIIRLPIIGDVLRNAAVARFSRTLATTSAAGVPLVDGLKAVSHATGNIIYRNACLQIGINITKGQQLQDAIRATKILPEMLIQMVAIGEKSGTLANMLSKVADFYEEEVNNKVDALSSLIEPIIMVVLGIIIGGLIIAMYLPIFKFGNVI